METVLLQLLMSIVIISPFDDSIQSVIWVYGQHHDV